MAARRRGSRSATSATQRCAGQRSYALPISCARDLLDHATSKRCPCAACSIRLASEVDRGHACLYCAGNHPQPLQQEPIQWRGALELAVACLPANHAHPTLETDCSSMEPRHAHALPILNPVQARRGVHRRRSVWPDGSFMTADVRPARRPRTCGARASCCTSCWWARTRSRIARIPQT